MEDGPSSVSLFCRFTSGLGQNGMGGDAEASNGIVVTNSIRTAARVAVNDIAVAAEVAAAAAMEARVRRVSEGMVRCAAWSWKVRVSVTAPEQWKLAIGDARRTQAALIPVADWLVRNCS